MSQRNPMNDRYQTDEHRGQTRKSAASMKPKTKAAGSVRVQPTTKTPAQKKAEKKAERAKQTAVDRRYYNPPTAEYKRMRKIWWGLLIGAIVATALSFLGRAWLPEAAAFAILGVAYLCIIAALYVDFSKIRKIRRAYQDEMESSKSKEVRALEKQQRAIERAAQEAAAAKAAAGESEEEKPKKRSLFGSGFRLSTAEGNKKAKQEAKASKAATKESDKADEKAAPEDDNAVFERAKATAKKASENASTDNDELDSAK